MKFIVVRIGLFVGALVVMCNDPARSQQPMMQETAQSQQMQTQTAQAQAVQAAANPTPATSPAGAVKGPANTIVAPPPPDPLGQYGKILAPGDQTNYPLKLKMPFPGVGEVKVPTQEEWNMRDKLERLSLLSDTDIRTQLAAWPAFSRMSLRDEGAMLQRLQDFRDYHSKMAMQKAHDMGLLTMTPADMARFEKEYWDKRLQMDHELIKQFQPIYQAQRQKMDEALYREFSLIAHLPGSGTPLNKPPAPPKPGLPAVNKPLQTASTAPVKPGPGGPTSDGALPPMAQAPR